MKENPQKKVTQRDCRAEYQAQVLEVQTAKWSVKERRLLRRVRRSSLRGC